MTCNSCGFEDPDESLFIPELAFNWTPTGNHVCRDPESCFGRYLAGLRASGAVR